MENGLKIYVCTDSESYILNFKFYPQEEKTSLLKVTEIAEIVKDICKPIKSENHILCANNFFSSVFMADMLK